MGSSYRAKSWKQAGLSDMWRHGIMMNKSKLQGQWIDGLEEWSTRVSRLRMIEWNDLKQIQRWQGLGVTYEWSVIGTKETKTFRG